jgi:hypothetical protein
MNREMVAIRIDNVSYEAPALFARLRVPELHTFRFQVGKRLADVIYLKHPTRPDTRLLVTSRHIRV